MTRTEALLREFANETRTARKHLERLPDEHFNWRPHPKSSTAGQLASHIVDCLRWVEPIFAFDELDFDENPIRPLNLSSQATLMVMFDEAVLSATEAMQQSSDANSDGLWRLKMRNKVWFEKTREYAFRDMTLHHLIHHRGQFSVYLRLLNIPVPGSYGPTADDQR